MVDQHSIERATHAGNSDFVIVVCNFVRIRNFCLTSPAVDLQSVSSPPIVKEKRIVQIMLVGVGPVVLAEGLKVATLILQEVIVFLIGRLGIPPFDDSGGGLQIAIQGKSRLVSYR